MSGETASAPPLQGRGWGGVFPLAPLRGGGGKLTPAAPLAPLVWFKSGGAAEWLFEPKDADDLAGFLRDLDPATPVMALGLGSNLIVRDGGVPGVVVRLGKAFAAVEALDATTLSCGAGASGILVSSTARDHGIAGLEFLRSIPGTVGGFVRMNGGAYGRETCDILLDCDVILRSGERVTLPVEALGYTYRHSNLPEGAIVVAARFRGTPGDPAAIQAEMDRIAQAREASTAAAQQNRRLDLQEPRWSQGLAVGRRSRLSRPDARRRTGQRETHQFPHQHRLRHQHRYRGFGRGSAAAGKGQERRGITVGNPAGGEGASDFYVPKSGSP